MLNPNVHLYYKNLTNEHHQEYTKLLNTNLMPKNNHLLHFPFIVEKVGPLINVWSICFKTIVLYCAPQGIISRENIIK